MRSLILALAASLLAGCGAPSVDVPKGNDQTTSQAPSNDLAAPTIQATPSSWPYGKIAIRGSAGTAARVLVEGAGNPAAANVQPLDGSFCVVVELAASPAHYQLTVQSQASDGTLSAGSAVAIDRANDAKAPSGATLCDGTPVGP